MSVKVAKRTLADIATEIRVELRTQTSSLLKVGRCLIEAKKQLKSAKGEDNKWLPWLASEVGMHERTAQRYLKAAKFAAKYDTVSYLSAEGEETLAVERLSPSAIYAISADVEDLYTPEAITAILEEAKTKEVDEDRALEIAQSLAPPDASVSTDEPEPEPSSDETASDEDDKSESRRRGKGRPDGQRKRGGRHPRRGAAYCAPCRSTRGRGSGGARADEIRGCRQAAASCHDQVSVDVPRDLSHRGRP